MATSATSPALPVPARRPGAPIRRSGAKSQGEVELDDHYLIALAKQGRKDAYDRIVKRYYGFVRLKASSYFLIGGDSDDLIQEGLVGLYKAVRDYRSDRESSFRNFAELCITRQIITAVKTSTRNKHTPLNEYVSFSQTPAAGVWEKLTYSLSGVCLLRVDVFTAVMIWRVMQSSAKFRKLDSRSQR